MDIDKLTELNARINLMDADEVCEVLGVNKRVLFKLPIPCLVVGVTRRRWTPKDVVAYAMKVSKTLTLNEIVGMAQPVFNGACVYFLLKDKEVVYIGKSTRFFTRVGKHAEGKDFDSVTFLPCELDDLDAIEAQYIGRFKPKHNILWKRND